MSFTDLAQQSRLVLVGILLFVIAYQFWIARLRRSEPILAMAAAWAVAALVIVTGRYVQHATLDPVTVILGSKVMHTGMLALVPIGFLLLHESREAPRGRLFHVMMVVTSIPVVLVWTGDMVISHRVRSFQSLAGPVLGPVSAPLGPFAVPYIAAIGGYLVYVARRGRRDLPWHRRLPLQRRAAPAAPDARQ